MYDIALRIDRKDWLYILLIGVIFGMLLSSLGYTLLERSWAQGMMFGLLLGLSITLFSLGFISYMNRSILPRVEKRFWLLIAILFSFLSGFLGTLLSSYVAEHAGIDLIPMFHTDIVKISVVIGVLTYVVGALLYRFVKMRNEKEVVDHHFVQSRLSSLETQLNPHFMFNALNSIAELVHHDPDKAETAILKVSAFLRNTMDEKALIPITKELKNVRDYIDLENIRFSDKISLDVSEDVPDWDIPKFSVQLLVENAIKHGMNSAQEDLQIILRFELERCIIIVENNGEAMRSTTFGIGLSNLDQRLELLCAGGLKVVRTDRPTFTIYLGDCHANTDRR